jgi:hypothetical protein
MIRHGQKIQTGSVFCFGVISSIGRLRCGGVLYSSRVSWTNGGSAAYEIGEKAGEQAPRDAKLPTDDELNMTAQKYFEQQGSRDQLQNPPPAGGLEARKHAFEQGYRDGFKKMHPEK